MTKSRKISDKEKVKILDDFLFRLHFHRYVSMNEQKVLAMLTISDAYVNAHSNHNGELSDAEVQANINAQLEKMRTLP